MASKRKRKTTPLMPAWANKPAYDLRLADKRGPTVERLDKTGDDYVRGHSGVYTLKDAPIDRALRDGYFSTREHSALVSYRTHWYYGGIASPLQGIDPNRIFASDKTSFASMPKTQNEAYHRDMYRKAVSELGIIQSAILDTVVCYEVNFEDTARMMGWSSKHKGIEAARRIVVRSARVLADMWGK